MKILIVTPVFWPESFRINDLAVAWAKKGHRVEVLAGHPNYPEGKFYNGYSWHAPFWEEWESVHILRFPQIPRGGGQSWRLSLQYISYIIFGSLRILTNKRWDWDAVFVFQTTPVTAALPALLAARISRSQSVIWVQDLWPDTLEAVGIKLPSIFQGIIEWLSGAIYSSFSRVIGQSQAFLPRLKELGVPEARLERVHQWADERVYPILEGLSPLWEPGFTVLFAGNLGRAQGLESILEAASLTRHIPRLQWVLMGDGALRPWLIKEVKRIGLEGKVMLPGRRPAEEIPTHYHRADILLVSLAKDPVFARTIPSKLQSYLAAGKAIIGAVEGEPARVILESGAGLVVKPSDPVALAEGVRQMANLSKQERERMAKMGKDYYLANFSRHICMEALERNLARIDE